MNNQTQAIIIEQQQDRILALCNVCDASEGKAKQAQVERSDTEMNARFFPHCRQGPKGSFIVTFGTYKPQRSFTVTCSVEIELLHDGSELAALSADPQLNPLHTLVVFKGQARPCVPAFAELYDLDGNIALNNNLFVINATEIHQPQPLVDETPLPCPILRRFPRNNNSMMQQTRPAYRNDDVVDEALEAELDEKYPYTPTALIYNMDTGKPLVLKRRAREVTTQAKDEQQAPDNTARCLFGQNTEVSS